MSKISQYAGNSDINIRYHYGLIQIASKCIFLSPKYCLRYFKDGFTSIFELV